ncbi:hypothetical protein [Butyrivibrio hungatei]|uniref:hypothetical protein n=1 Tax=Butyrivibrio hungatei TaxID=185008 RepID=UPI00042567BF|nr:hypothetical protein [Butyrivibrio hungatei]
MNNNNENEYYQRRKNHKYYKYIRFLLSMLARETDSICDVGSNGVDVISFLPCREMTSIDIANPFSSEKVKGIVGDFLSYPLPQYNIITCFQVLEHISDEKVHVFADRLLELGDIAVISVPFMWEKGYCLEHVQDPIDIKKFLGWFSVPPVFTHKIIEENGRARLVAVFINANMTEKLYALSDIEPRDIFCI